MIIRNAVSYGIFSIALSVLPLSAYAADLDAETNSTDKSHSFYVSAFGGGSFAQDPDGSLEIDGIAPLDVSQSVDSGFIAGVSVGKEIFGNFRGELEFSFRQNEQGAFDFTNAGLTSTATEGENLNSYAVLANLWYDVAAAKAYNITPYVGGGIGLGIIDVNVSDAAVALGDPEDLTGVGFAFQVGTGVNYAVTDNIDLGVGYRFSGIIADIDGRDNTGLNASINDTDIYSHNVIGSIKYNF